MVYPQNIETKLGFDKIREYLGEECQGILGRQLIDKMEFHNDYEAIASLTEQTAEFKKLIETGQSPPESYYFDVSAYLAKASIVNNFLTESEFYDVKRSLDTLYQTLRVIRRQPKAEFPRLQALCQDIDVPYEVIQDIERVIDDKGQMRNNASAELQKIRQDIVRTQVTLRKKLVSIVEGLRKNDYLRSDVETTVREGRMVVPIKTEYRKQLKGIVHDTSSTGQTIFIEPEAIVDLNNDIKQLLHQERFEIVRILTDLTTFLRPHLHTLKYAYEFLAQVDFIRAKARFAIKLNAINPTFEKRALIDWQNAFHPLLYLSHTKQGKKVYPNTLYLDGNQRILLISGPNAGGKSVLLKTVGLLQYMYQTGLLIPVQEGSKVGIFDQLFIDIGDEQSIDNDLSTYSSHLYNMKKFLIAGNKRTLALIDEFGTGTEPQVGASIAEAILEEFEKQRMYAVITTHYANLKFMAEKSQFIVNGAMRYDVDNLEPLFKLEIGKPGSSFALEIAKKIGLPSDVIKSAHSKLGGEQLEVERLLRQLEKQRSNLDRQQTNLRKQGIEVDKLLKENQQLKDDLKKNKQKYMQEAKKEAQELLQNANKRIENTIRSIKENQADKQKTKALRKDLEGLQDELDKVTVEPIQKETSKNEDEIIRYVDSKIEEGDFVQIKGQTAIAEVLSIKNKDVLLRIGALKTTVKMNRLQKVDEKVLPSSITGNKNGNSSSSAGSTLHTKVLDFSPDLDVRGKRAEEVNPIVTAFMDDAVMLSQKNLRILHGKGEGVLRQVVRDALRQYPQVQTMKDEHADRGGAGVTIVTLR
ncbi:endonuclease MutS2 [Bernardetia sp.]|uniref:endonuclease MutS2 n=1 Tax=Bernardetia sp. TaxID=1937974 RepID=UPI0025BEF292|nr:endonuclease MutS2 [Bernardetia sp.]